MPKSVQIERARHSLGCLNNLRAAAGCLLYATVLALIEKVSL